MELVSSDSKSKWDRSKFIIHITVFILVILITGYHCVTTLIRYHYLFSWHVIFGSISYLLLMPVSVMIFDEILLKNYTRKQKSKIHGIIILVATISAVLSVAIDYSRKEVYKPQYPNIVHFESAHAITGLISVILYVLANFSGLFTYKISWFQEKVIAVRPVVLKLCHNLMGQVAYILGMISIIVVLITPWFIHYNTIYVAVIMSVLISFVTIWSLINSFVSTYNQIQTLTS